MEEEVVLYDVDYEVKGKQLKTLRCSSYRIIHTERDTITLAMFDGAFRSMYITNVVAVCVTIVNDTKITMN